MGVKWGGVLTQDRQILFGILSEMKRNILLQAYRLLNPSQRKQGLGIVLLLFVNSLLDFFSLAFFLPVIFLLINPGAVQVNLVFRQTYQFFGFQDLPSFAIAITVAVFVFIVLKTLINLWIARRKARYAYGVGGAMASRAVGRYLEIPYDKFTQMTLSHEVNVMSSLPLVFANNILIPAGTLLSEGMVFLLLITGMAIYDIRIFGYLSVILIPALLVYRLRRLKLKRIGSAIRNSYTALLRYTLLIVEGLPDIITFRKEAHFRRQFEKTCREMGKSLSTDYTLHAGTPRVTEVIAAACVCTMIIYVMLQQVNLQDALMLLSVYAAASFRIIPSVNRIIGAMQQMKVHEYSIKEFTAITHGSDAKRVDAKETPLVFREQITLQNISFGYPGHANILHDINLTIQKGGKIAMKGKSGAGKSTLLLILLGFLREHQGTISIDGQLTHNPEPRRKLFGYVPQHPYIMDGSVLENIAFGVPEADVDLAKATRLVRGMDLEHWVASLPQGLHSRIGEKGAKISGGQRQRLAIARTLYHEAEILLLDEVTNQLDPETEREVVTTLLNLADRSKTILMITHHPELLKKFDTVYELVDGRLHRRGHSVLQSAQDHGK